MGNRASGPHGHLLHHKLEFTPLEQTGLFCLDEINNQICLVVQQKDERFLPLAYPMLQLQSQKRDITHRSKWLGHIRHSGTQTRSETTRQN
jgi:hypothetical protein